jgi:hypothetical protein
LHPRPDKLGFHRELARHFYAENSLTFLNDMIYLQATAVTSNEQPSNQQQATSNHS